MSKEPGFIKSVAFIGKEVSNICAIKKLEGLREVVVIRVRPPENFFSLVLQMASLERFVFVTNNSWYVPHIECKSPLQVLSTCSSEVANSVIRSDQGTLRVLDLIDCHISGKTMRENVCTGVEIASLTRCRAHKHIGWLASLPKLKELRLCEEETRMDLRAMRPEVKVVRLDIDSWCKRPKDSKYPSQITYFEPHYFLKAIGHTEAVEMWLKEDFMKHRPGVVVRSIDMPLFPPPFNDRFGKYSNMDMLSEVVKSQPLDFVQRLVDEFDFEVTIDSLKSAMINGSFQMAKYLLSSMQKQTGSKEPVLISTTDFAILPLEDFSLDELKGNEYHFFTFSFESFSLKIKFYFCK